MAIPMKTKRLHNLTTQQIGWFLIVALVPLLIMGSAALLLAKEAITQEILRDLADISEIRKHQVEDYFAERQHHLLNLSQSAQLISESRLQQQPRYNPNHLLRINPTLPALIQQWGMKNLVMLSPQGVITADLLEPESVGLNLQDEFYQDAVLKRAHQQVMERHILSDPHHAYFEPYDRFTTFLAAPIRDGGRIIGVVAAEIDMSRLSRILAPSGSNQNSSGMLLATGNESGVSLLHLDWEVPEPDQACRDYRRDHLDTLPMIQALQGESGAGWNIDTACEPILVTWRPLPQLNLGMTLFKTEDQALATVDQLRAILFQTGSVAVFFALLLAFFVSLPLIRPLLQLTQLTRNISQGKTLQTALEQLPQKVRINEIRELSDSIGKMLTTIDNHTQDLEEYQQNLEHHVYYRTAALKKSQKEAEAANRSKGEFLARMSHEIRTPLNGIVGLAELLNEIKLEPQQQRYVEALSTSSHHLSELLNNILDFSKIEANQFTLQEHPFSLKALIEQISTIVSMEADHKGLRFKSRVQPTIHDQLMGDPKVLRQVLLNLLSNAIKYTEQGRIDLVITLEIDGPQEITLRIRVSDSGRGIPAAAQERLFTAFHRHHEQEENGPEGTGLGLTITRSLVKQMGGEIWVQSTEHQGSDFYILLPLRIAQKAQESTPLPPPATADDEATHYTILLADDSEINRLVIESFLSNERYQVISVEQGAAAVEAYQQQPIDLILMDLRMPVLNGIEATQQIRSLEQQQQRAPIPIIAMTADVLQETRSRAMEAGCTHWLPKPTSKQQFFTTLQQALHAPATETTSPAAEASPLTALFLTDSLEKLEQMISLQQEEDWPALSEIAHALKGNALILGLTDLGTLLQQLQQAADDRDATHFEQLRSQFEQVMEEMGETP